MPGRDGTGPIGMGAMTGRRMGFCAGGFQGPGRGFGRMPGWNRFMPPQIPVLEPENETGVLKSRADALQAELDSIRKRLSSMEKEAEE